MPIVMNQGCRPSYLRSLRYDFLLFPDGCLPGDAETAVDRGPRAFIDDVDGDPGIVPVVDDLALTGVDLTGLAGSSRLLPIFELSLLLITIPWLPE